MYSRSPHGVEQQHVVLLAFRVVSQCTRSCDVLGVLGIGGCLAILSALLR